MPQLRRLNDSRINSEQVMMELLKMTFFDFFREVEGSNSVFQPKNTNLHGWLEARRALDCLNPHTDAGPDGLFTKILEALSPHIPLYLPGYF